MGRCPDFANHLPWGEAGTVIYIFKTQVPNWKTEEDNACLWDAKKIILETPIECDTQQQTKFDHKRHDLAS